MVCKVQKEVSGTSLKQDVEYPDGFPQSLLANMATMTAQITRRLLPPTSFSTTIH
jgi:hypothetical protein